jgi:glyoxylase-like metal-dependent hydrolase (beta-lactamase superfamily II)
MNRFLSIEYFPGVYHITDPMGVQFTLIMPAEGGALLFDAGHGIHESRPLLEGLLKKRGLDLDQLTVMVSHAHYDHLPGVRWFDSFRIHPEELPVLKTYTQETYLRRISSRAREMGRLPPDFDEGAFFRAGYQDRAQSILPTLPGIDILHIPGHTPGSLVVYVREHRLLLTADNWNPTTWLFFPEALPVEDYAANMRRLLSLDFEHVLCSHARDLIPGERLRRFIRGLSPQTFAQAVPANTPYPEMNPVKCRPEPESEFVFRDPRGYSSL